MASPSSLIEVPLTPLEMFEQRLNVAKQHILSNSKSNTTSRISALTRSRGRSRSAPDIKAHSPLFDFDARHVQSKAIQKNRDRQAVAHLVTEQLVKNRRAESGDASKPTTDFNSEDPKARHLQPVVPIPLDPHLLFPKPSPIRGTRDHGYHSTAAMRSLSPPAMTSITSPLPEESTMNSGRTDTKLLIQNVAKYLLPKLRNSNNPLHTVSSTSSTIMSSGDERSQTYQGQQYGSPSSRRPRDGSSKRSKSRDHRFEQFEALRLAQYQFPEAITPSQLRDDRKDSKDRKDRNDAFMSPERLPELRGIRTGDLPHRVSKSGNSRPSTVPRSGVIGEDISTEIGIASIAIDNSMYPHPESRHRKRYNYDLNTPQHQEEFVFPRVSFAANTVQQPPRLNPLKSSTIITRISTESDDSLTPPSPKEETTPPPQSTNHNEDQPMQQIKGRDIGIQRVETLHALMVEYWWVIVVIASVILILLVVSCSLLIKQCRFGNEQNKLKREQMQKVIVHREHSKWSEEMHQRRMSRYINRRIASKMHHHNVYIERTRSQQAPCKMYMVCHNIGKGRFGDVRLAIDPQIESPPTSNQRTCNSNDHHHQISPKSSDFHCKNIDSSKINDPHSRSSSMWPSLPSELPDAHHPSSIQLHSPRYYALKRARFSARGNGHNAEVWSIFHEIMILSQLNHRGIVKYHGNGVANHHIQLFLEWLPIGSMADILSIRKSFSIHRIRSYLIQLLDALDYLHSKHIYHRDIKSRNILLCSDGGCKLADFGSAVDVSDRGNSGQNTGSNYLNHSSKSKMHTHSWRTHSVPSAGTVHWWPPETCCHSEEDYGVLSGHDVWNLGVTTIEMICGVPPFHHLPVQNFMMMMRATPSQYVDEIPVTSNSNLNSFVTACITVNHHHRPTIKELLEYKFITHSITKQHSPRPSMDILLKEKASHAKRYAKSIVTANLSLWFQAMDGGSERTGFSVSGTCTVSEPERSFAVNEQMILQQHGVDPDAYRRSIMREYHHFHARNL